MSRSRLFARTLFGLGCCLVVATLVSQLVMSELLRQDARARVFQGLDGNIRNALAAMHSLGGAPEVVHGGLYVGTTPLDGNDRLVDDMRASAGVEITLFHDDTAIATTLRDAAGRRRLGARMPSGAAHDAIYLHGQPYQSIETIGDETYFAAWRPIVNSYGDVVGAMQVAETQSEASRRADAWRTAIIVLSCAAIGAIGVIFFLYNRGMSGHLDANEEDLRTTNRNLDTALENMANGLCLFGPDNVLVLASEHYVNLLGLPAGSLAPGMTLRRVLRALLRERDGLARDIDHVHAMVVDRLHGAERPGTLEYDWRGKRLAVHHTTLPNGSWLVTYEDVTERHAAEQRVAHMAVHDPVTGLANRVKLNKKLETVAGKEAVALLVLDLDHFKTINDALGHPVGDALLRDLGARLTATVPDSALVARLGGDEFAVVHENVPNRDKAADLAHQLIAAVREPFEVDGNTLNVDASVGIVLPKPEDTVEALMRQVDMALYRAKDSGRGTFAFYEPEMDRRLHARRTLTDDLRRAIANAELDLFYQPLLHTRSGKITGFEALMRWHHPDRGMVSPGEFIPVAEETGLIVPMGSWALRRACRDAVRWPAVKIAVNLSAVQLRDDKLVAVVGQALGESGLRPALLELEITETALVGDKARALAMLRALRSLGVQIAMDDFGTGYSSLAYFREFPFDKVKIDRMFVEGLGMRKDCDAVVSAVMGIAADLEMVTLAEGVETAQQLQRLRERGCNEVQGFLFSRPVPADQVPALIERFGIHKEPIRHVSYATRSAARGA